MTGAKVCRAFTLGFYRHQARGAIFRAKSGTQLTMMSLARQLAIEFQDFYRHVRRGVHVFNVEPLLDGVNRTHAGSEIGALDASAVEDVRITPASGSHRLNVQSHARRRLEDE